MGVFRERKGRYNVSLYGSVVHDMDLVARRLGVSRSELIEYVWHDWVRRNSELTSEVGIYG